MTKEGSPLILPAEYAPRPEKERSSGIILAFPGQGSHYEGLGWVAGISPGAQRVFDDTNTILRDIGVNVDVQALCTQAPKRVLDDTPLTQLSIFTTSLAMLAALRDKSEIFRSLKPDFFMGHSSGEIAALVASETIDLQRGVKIICARGAYMKAAGEKRPGSMTVVMGLEETELDAIAKKNNVFVANKNSPLQMVLSGETERIERAEREMAEEAKKEKKGRRIRVQRLAISIASHSPLMEEAGQQFGEFITNIPFNDAIQPLITNVDSQPHKDGDDIKAAISAALTSTVRWSASVQEACAQGARYVLEIGPGGVLTGLVQRITDKAQGFSVDELLKTYGVDIDIDPLLSFQQKRDYAGTS